MFKADRRHYCAVKGCDTQPRKGNCCHEHKEHEDDYIVFAQNLCHQQHKGVAYFAWCLHCTQPHVQDSLF